MTENESHQTTAFETVYQDVKKLDRVQSLLLLIADRDQRASGGAPNKPVELAAELISEVGNALIVKLTALPVSDAKGFHEMEREKHHRGGKPANGAAPRQSPDSPEGDRPGDTV